MGFSRRECWRGSCPPPGHLRDPGIEPRLLRLLHRHSTTCEALFVCRARDFFSHIYTHRLCMGSPTRSSRLLISAKLFKLSASLWNGWIEWPCTICHGKDFTAHWFSKPKPGPPLPSPLQPAGAPSRPRTTLSLKADCGDKCHKGNPCWAAQNISPTGCPHKIWLLEERKGMKQSAESQDEEKNKAEPRIQFSLQLPRGLCRQSDGLLDKLILPCC